MSDAPNYLRMSPEELARLGGPELNVPAAPADAPAAPNYLRMSPEELGKLPDPVDAQQGGLYDRWKAALPANVTALVRGTGGLIDAAWDPYGTIMSPIRKIISPEQEAKYQAAEQPGPGRKLGD